MNPPFSDHGQRRTRPSNGVVANLLADIVYARLDPRITS
jgi:hypothetical protein